MNKIRRSRGSHVRRITTPQGAVREAKEGGLANMAVDADLAAIGDREVWFKRVSSLQKVRLRRAGLFRYLAVRKPLGRAEARQGAPCVLGAGDARCQSGPSLDRMGVRRTILSNVENDPDQ
jgi:hypothetical protein